MKLCGRQPPQPKNKTMTDETENTEQSRVAADCPNGRLVMPLRINESEINRRINAAMWSQPKYAVNSNFYLKGWDAAKVRPTVKAILIEVGLVELIDA